MSVLGVDGCRGGWLAAELDDENGVVWAWTDDVRELFARPVDVVAIDITIGLPDSGRRVCDVQARAALGRRGVSVFPAPVRAVLGCSSYAEARALLADAGAGSMSAQAFGIVAAVRQVDEALSCDPRRDRVVEAHPELAFALMGGGPGLPGKRSAEGVALRRGLLSGWLRDLDDVLSGVPRRAAPDDALDALACAWVARRRRDGTARVFGDGAHDSRGLPMRIVA